MSNIYLDIKIRYETVFLVIMSGKIQKNSIETWILTVAEPNFSCETDINVHNFSVFRHFSD